jgi:hypothetical protein
VGGKLALWWKDTGDYPGAAVRIYNNDIIGGGTINLVTSITNSVKPPIENGAYVPLTQFIRKAYDTSDFDVLRDSIAAHTKTLLAGGNTFTESGKGLNWAMNSDGASILFHNTGDGDTNSRLEFKTWDNGDEYFSFTDVSMKPLLKIMPNGGISPVLINDKPAIHTGNYGALSRELEMEKWLASRPKNLADSRLWVVGTNNAPQLAHPMSGGGFTMNGDRNACELRVDPWGRPAITWRCVGNDTASDDDGGWNKSIGGINHLSNYMSVVYFRINVGGTASSDGTFYHGLQGDLNPENGNPYYTAALLSVLPVGKWLVSVGYLLSSGAVDASLAGSIWDVSTGAKLLNSTSYKQAVGNTRAAHRSYLFYSNNPLVDIEWWNPIFCEVDGTEPSMRELLGKSNESFLTNTLISDAVSTALTTIRGEQKVIVDAQTVKITALTQELAELRSANQELLRQITVFKARIKELEDATPVTYTLSAPTVGVSGSTVAGEVSVLTASGSTFTPSKTDTVVYYWTLPNGSTATGNSVRFTNGAAGSVATASVVAKGTTQTSTSTSASVVSTPAAVVEPPAPIAPTVTNPSISSTSSRAAGASVTLTASDSVVTPAGLPITYEWTKPDGGTATGSTLAVVMGSAGMSFTYSVVAKVTGGVSIVSQITLTSSPTVAVVYTLSPPTVVVSGSTVVGEVSVLTASGSTWSPSSDTHIEYLWSLPNGNTATGNSISFTNGAAGSVATATVVAKGAGVATSTAKVTTVTATVSTVTATPVIPTVVVDAVPLGVLLNFAEGGMTLLPGMSVSNGSITFTDTSNYKYTVTGNSVAIGVTGDVTALLGSVYSDGALSLLPGMSVSNGSITFTDTPPFKYTVIGSTVSVVVG